MSGVGNVKRSVLTVLIGLAVVAGAGLHAGVAMASDMYGIPECAVSGAYRVLPVNTTCWSATETFSATAGSAVQIRAAAVVDDSAHATDTGYRAEYDTVVHCYDAGGTARYAQGAIRNIWRGANPAGLYPSGVFMVPATGSYTCIVALRQVTLSGESAQSYLVRNTYVTAAAHPIGQSSGGPNLDPWDALPFDYPAFKLVPPGATIDGGRLQWTVPAGASSLTLVGMTNITSCSFNSDTAGGHPCSGYVTSGTASLTVRLLAWQTVSGSTSQCAAPATASTDVSITPVIHHYTLAQSGSITLTGAAGCTRQLVLKTTVTNSGPASVYVTNIDTLVGAVS
jgi:hypothetical protein